MKKFLVALVFSFGVLIQLSSQAPNVSIKQYICNPDNTYNIILEVYGAGNTKTFAGYHVDADIYEVTSCYDSNFDTGGGCFVVLPVPAPPPVCACNGTEYPNGNCAENAGFPTWKNGPCTGNERVVFTIHNLPSQENISVNVSRVSETVAIQTTSIQVNHNCNAIPIFTDVTPPSFNTISSCDAQIGDIDNDGDMDMVIGEFIARNSNGTFILSNYPNSVAFSGNGSLLDLNQEGWLDHKGAKVSLNQMGFYFSSNIVFPGSNYVKLIDFDNNGISSILSGIEAQSSCQSYVSDDCTLYDIDNYSCVKNIEPKTYNIATDFDGDMDYELLTNNNIYNNLQSNTSILSALPFNIENAKSIDINNDGKVDIINVGSSKPIEIMLNNGSIFNLNENSYGQVHTADINNDGHIDILNNGISFKDGGQLSFTNFKNLPGFNRVHNLFKPIDFDNDGDLDLLVLRYDETPKLYRNDSRNKNNKPNRPQNPKATVTDKKVVFSWTHGGDDLTTYPTYNLYVKNLTTNKVIYFPHSDTLTGQLRLLDKGNCEYNNGWFLQNLPAGRYRWKVQAVDQGYRGSEWTLGQNFEIADPICDTEIEMVKLVDDCDAPRIVSTGEILRICEISAGLPALPAVGQRAMIGYTIVSCGPSTCNFAQKQIKITCIESLNIPNITISGNDTICEGATTTLSAAGGSLGSTYLWSNNATTSSITIAPPINTTYTVTVTHLNGSKSSASASVVVRSAPNIPSSGIVTICAGASTTLSAANGSFSNTYLWSNNATTSSITVSPTTNTTYTVTLTDLHGCKSSASASVVLITVPNISILGNTMVCVGASTTLSAAGGSVGSTYLWSNNATTSSISVSPTINTTYTVTVTDTNRCKSSTSASIAISSVPNISISGNAMICAGASTTISAAGGSVGSTYLWSNNATTSSITVSPSSNTNYTVTVTDISGCKASASTSVNISPLPIAQIIGSTSICNGSSTTLTATGGTSYLWSNNATTSAITIAPSSNTNYTVTVTDISGCKASASTSVGVLPLPIPQLIGNTSICNGSSTTLTASGGTTYRWANNATTSAITVSPNITSIYTVTVSDQNSCTSSAILSVKVTSSKSAGLPMQDTISLCQKDSTIDLAALMMEYDNGGTWKLNNAPIQSTKISLGSLPYGYYKVNYGHYEQMPCAPKDTNFILWVKDCRIKDCSFVLADDNIVVNINEVSTANLVDNDLLPADHEISIVSVKPNVLSNKDLSSGGVFSFTVDGNFGDFIQVTYEICTPYCDDCKRAILWIDNAALKDIIRTNIILPNSNGKNAALRFTEDDVLQDSELYIFNRNGDKIFYMKDYDNSWSADGYPGGIYYYVLKYKGVDIKRALTVMK